MPRVAIFPPSSLELVVPLVVVLKFSKCSALNFHLPSLARIFHVMIHTDCKNQNSAFLEQKLASLVRGLAIQCVPSAMAKSLQRYQVTGSIATLAFARVSSEHEIILHRLSPSF